MPAKVKLTAKDKEAIELDRQRDEDDRAQTEERAAFLRLFEKTTQAELLEESLKSRKVFHAYLFHGPKGSLKEEAAILFGVSILAGSNGLFNEVTASEAELEAAMQAYRGDHSDFIFLNGNRKEQIKKEEVDDIQRRFYGGFGHIVQQDETGLRIRYRVRTGKAAGDQAKAGSDL